MRLSLVIGLLVAGAAAPASAISSSRDKKPLAARGNTSVSGRAGRTISAQAAGCTGSLWARLRCNEGRLKTEAACAVELGAFGPLKALKALKIIKGYYKTRRVSTALKPIYRVYDDVTKLYQHHHREFAAIWKRLEQAKSVKDFVSAVLALVHDTHDKNFRQFVRDFADLVGVKDCVDVLLAPSPPSRPVTTQYRTVRIDWNTNQTDIDLHVWDPAGNEAWYQAQGGIPNGQLSTDITTGFGPETFTTTDTRTPLAIGVCYYAANTGDGSVPPTNVTVTITEANGAQRVDHVMLNDVKQEDVVDSSPAGAAVFAPNSGWCDSDNGGNNSGPANTLYAGQTLNPGAFLLSPDHQYELIMQGDGNLVLYQAGSALWSSGTAGDSGATATMQTDGNFVIYNGGVAKWNSGTSGFPGAVLVLQDDSNLVIYQGSTAIWDWPDGRLV